MKKEIKPGVFVEIVEDDIHTQINQEYLSIPNIILRDQSLKAAEKMIMGTVLSLTNNNKEAFHSNRLLGAMLSLSASRVSALISGLVKRQYLFITYHKNQQGHVLKRYLIAHERYDKFNFQQDDQE